MSKKLNKINFSENPFMDCIVSKLSDIEIGHKYLVVERGKQIKVCLITVKYIKNYTDKSIQLCDSRDYEIIYNGSGNYQPFILCLEHSTTFYDFDSMSEDLQELILNYNNYENLLDNCIKYDF